MFNWTSKVLAHLNNSPLVDMPLLKTHYADSEPTSLCRYSFKLCA